MRTSQWRRCADGWKRGREFCREISARTNIWASPAYLREESGTGVAWVSSQPAEKSNRLGAEAGRGGAGEEVPGAPSYSSTSLLRREREDSRSQDKWMSVICTQELP